jgi:hypothetical protein
VLALSQALTPTHSSTNSTSLHSFIVSAKYKTSGEATFDHPVEWEGVDWIHLAQDVDQ